MKVHWLKFIFVLMGVLTLSLCVSDAYSQKKISRKAASVIVEATDEISAFYQLQEGHFRNCLEKSVELPCESDWVSCIENAWVVRFYAGEQCLSTNDERLSVTMVVNSESGEIISRFPELDYFQEPIFCRDDFDCLYVQAGEKSRPTCLNFIHAMSSGIKWNESEHCACQESKCLLSQEGDKDWKSLEDLDPEEFKKLLFEQ